MGRCLFGILVVLGALVPGVAHAALVIDFEPASAPPGTVVIGVTRGAALGGVEAGYYELLLAPSQQVADAVTGRGEPKDPRLVPIGRLDADNAGVGRIRFSVPNIQSGTYTVVAFCEGCTPRGSTFSAVGRLAIRDGAALPPTGARTPGIFVFVGASLLLTGIALLKDRAAVTR